MMLSQTRVDFVICDTISSIGPEGILYFIQFCYLLNFQTMDKRKRDFWYAKLHTFSSGDLSILKRDAVTASVFLLAEIVSH